MSYQDIWRDGKLISRGQRDCEGRYDAIRRSFTGLIEHRRDPLRILDVGAFTGYFSIRLAEDFDAHVTAADDYAGLRQVDHPDIAIVPNRVTPGEVWDLGPWDVVLQLSTLHHMPDWRRMLAMSVDAAKAVYVELPDIRENLPAAVAHGETQLMHERVRSMGGVIIHWADGFDGRYARPLYQIGSL